jgi:hypothetical protein
VLSLARLLVLSLARQLVLSLARQLVLSHLALSHLALSLGLSRLVLSLVRHLVLSLAPRLVLSLVLARRHRRRARDPVWQRTSQPSSLGAAIRRAPLRGGCGTAKPSRARG